MRCRWRPTKKTLMTLKLGLSTGSLRRATLCLSEDTHAWGAGSPFTAWPATSLSRQFAMVAGLTATTAFVLTSVAKNARGKRRTLLTQLTREAPIYLIQCTQLTKKCCQQMPL